MAENLMTVGEIAKEAKVSVRTLQYYDKCGLLRPSAYSEGGNRLYSSKDLAMLYQIKGLKHLGLSLDEIKEHLISFNEVDKVLEILQAQKAKTIKSIKGLQDTLAAVELLEREIIRDNSVDFDKYVTLIAGFYDQMQSLWLLNIMEPGMIDHVVNNRYDDETIGDSYENMINILDAIINAHESGLKPDSLEAQELASLFWDHVESFANGNLELFPSMLKLAENLENNSDNITNEFAEKWKAAKTFTSEILEIYLVNNQINFPGVNDASEED